MTRSSIAWDYRRPGVRYRQAQRGEDPPGRVWPLCNQFGKVHKVFFITADSLHYDFRRLGTLDFVFIDGAHDLAHVLSDSRSAYAQLRPGGCLVWHDYDSRCRGSR